MVSPILSLKSTGQLFYDISMSTNLSLSIFEHLTSLLERKSTSLYTRTFK